MLLRLLSIFLISVPILFAQDSIIPEGTYTPSYFAELLDAEVYSSNTIYLLGVGGFVFINVSDISNPKFISRYDPRSIYKRFYNGIAKGNLAAGAARDDGVYFIDIKDINKPSLKSIHSRSSFTSYESVDFKNDVAYAAIHEKGLEVINITNLENPVSLKVIWGLTNCWDVFIHNNYLYVADGPAGLKIFDLQDARNPVLVDSVATSSAAYEIIVEENHAYIAMGAAGFDIIDVTDPKNPGWLSTYSSKFGILNHLNYENNKIFAATWELVQVIDVSNPADPVLLATEDTPYRAMGIAVNNNKIYVCDWFKLETYSFGFFEQPDIHVKPRTFDFGFKGNNETISKKFEIFNLGQSDLVIDTIYTVEEVYQIFPKSLVVEKNSVAEITVDFTPEFDTDYSDQLRFFSNDPDESIARVPVSGGANGLTIGDIAPDFTLTSVNYEREYTLSELRGKIVVMAIFASW